MRKIIEEKYCDVCNKLVYNFGVPTYYTGPLIVRFTVGCGSSERFVNDICLDCARELHDKYMEMKHNK